MPVRLRQVLPSVAPSVGILAVGRLLSQIGTGFTLFYAPIVFGDRLGLSVTTIGLGLGLGSATGILGRFLSGSLADSPRVGCRQTLLLSAVLSALGDFAFVGAQGVPLFLLGNGLMGLGGGLYWPATESIVTDCTPAERRGEAFALTRLADNVGLSLGVIVGGVLLSLRVDYRWLFGGDGISYLLFLLLVYRWIPETRSGMAVDLSLQQPLGLGWGGVLRDRALLLFCGVNVLFTTYLAQLQSTLPLYLSRPLPGGANLAAEQISLLFSGYVVLTACLQLPVALVLRRWGALRSLSLAAGLWGLGFGLLGVTGLVCHRAAFCLAARGGGVAIALGVIGLATVLYLPAGSAFVADLAPPEGRGRYLALNSQCWAIGYLLGPSLGGWALEQLQTHGSQYWSGAALSVVLIGFGLRHLTQGRRS